MTTLIENRQPKTLPSGFEIESWDDVIGNSEFTVLCKDLVERVRNEGSREAFRMLVTGVSRGGKTSLIEYLIKTLLCCNLDRTTLVPCGRCVNCSDRVYKHGTGDWTNHVAFFDDSNNSTPVRYHYHPLDCSRAGTKEIEDLLNEINRDDGDFRIIYLDEVHRLSRQSLDERFLKPLESYRAIWIASSAMVKESASEGSQKLDKMFQNRFPFRIQTEKPSEVELAVWLVARCRQFGLTCDDPETLKLLARRADRIPGMALQVLDRAHLKKNRELTKKMVEQFQFDFDQ